MPAKTFAKCLILVAVLGAMVIGSAYYPRTAKVIQIDVSAVLDARSVTTLNKGVLETWSTGIDKADGYLTMAAALSVGDLDPHALPDNPLFPATASHPGILLHYSNETGLAHQTKCIPDSGEFVIKTPHHKYSGLWLSLTSSYGASNLEFELGYADGVEKKNKLLPDWYNDVPANDPDLAYVAHNMGKWDSNNKMKEKDHHNIHALN